MKLHLLSSLFLVSLYSFSLCSHQIKRDEEIEHKQIEKELSEMKIEEHKNLYYDKVSNSDVLVVLRSISAGSLLGASIGMLTKKIDNSVGSIWPLTWFAATYANDKIVNEIAKNFDGANINYSPEILGLSAWIATWFGYMVA